jgi:signal transduction histidine kinase
LGLAIVKAICTAHGAEINVSSQEGRGSHFTVELPLLDVPESDLAKPVLRTR